MPVRKPLRKCRRCGLLVRGACALCGIGTPRGKRQPTGPRTDLRGMQFTRLTVLECVGRDPHRKVLWQCKCECGDITIVRADKLLTGRIRSCGCWREDGEHMASRTPDTVALVAAAATRAAKLKRKQKRDADLIEWRRKIASK
jgi:hypothetical protein